MQFIRKLCFAYIWPVILVQKSRKFYKHLTWNIMKNVAWWHLKYSVRRIYQYNDDVILKYCLKYIDTYNFCHWTKGVIPLEGGFNGEDYIYNLLPQMSSLSYWHTITEHRMWHRKCVLSPFEYMCNEMHGMRRYTCAFLYSTCTCSSSLGRGIFSYCQLNDIPFI